MSLDQSIRHLNHRRIDFSRAFVLKLTTWLVRGFSRFYPSEAKRSILVLRMDGKLGDSICSTGFLRELKRAFPERKLVVVAGTSTVDLYKALPFVDEVYIGQKGLFKTLSVYFELKKINFDFIINTSHILNPRTVFLVACLQAFKKIGFGGAKDGIFSEQLTINFKTEHVTDRYRAALRAVGVMNAEKLSLDYEITRDVTDAAVVAEHLAKWRGADFKLVLLNSFAGGRLRNLSEQTSRNIAELLLKDPRVVVISAANRGDHDILSRWLRNEKTGRWVHFPQLSTLNQNVALADACDLILTPDTAWVHIASALHKKLVAIYRQDVDPVENNSVIWAPYGANARVIYAVSAAGSTEDINNLKPELVAEAILNLLFKN